jgi:hypothetical protein
LTNRAATAPWMLSVLATIAYILLAHHNVSVDYVRDDARVVDFRSIKHTEQHSLLLQLFEQLICLVYLNPKLHKVKKMKHQFSADKAKKDERK